MALSKLLSAYKATPLTNGDSIIPAQSGVKYLVHMVTIVAKNDAACTSIGAKVSFTDEDGLPVMISCLLVPSAANQNSIIIPDLNIKTRSGAPVSVGWCGNVASPEYGQIMVTYQEVSE